MSHHYQPPEHPTASTNLLQSAQQMDPEGWSRLVTTFGPIVYRWCRTSGIAESDAPDVVQDVFASGARGIGGFERQKEQGSFRSWLATITRNRIRDHWRHAARSVTAQGGTGALEFLREQAENLDSTVCADGMETPLIHSQLEAVRAEFEPLTWKAFWLSVVEEKPTSVVAEITGLSHASIYQAKSRIMRRLRNQLSQLPT